MGCDKINHRCGKKQYGVCTAYESAIPEYSELFEQECVSIEETTLDLYSLITGIKNDIDVSTLDLECLSLSTPTLKTLLQTLISKCCDLTGIIETQATTIGTITQQITDLQTNNCP